MEIKTVKHLILPLIVSALSGTALSLAFPEYDMTWLAWVALVPMMTVLMGQKPLTAFFIAYVGGMVFFLGVFGWILNISGYTLLHHAALDLYLSLYFGVFGWAFAFIGRRRGTMAALLAAPALWCLLEYARCNFAFLALPMSVVGHSQYRFASVLQTASLSGVYGISFLVVAVNASLTALILNWAPGVRAMVKTGASGRPEYKLIFVPLAAAVLFSGAVLYGRWALSVPLPEDRFTVALVQGNIEQERKWNPRFTSSILQTYGDMTLSAAAERPALIIWPEAATPGSILVNQRLSSTVHRIAASAGTYLLLGSAQQRKLRPTKKTTWRFYNSAFLFPPDIEGSPQRYDKMRLMPFGEYLPLRETLPWSLLGVEERGAFDRGERYTIFETPHFRFGTTICWENLFPELTRRFVREGAQFIVNITNIAHFGRSAVPYQVASMNVFRAVENRVYVVRCTNTGISCFIDPYGRIMSRVTDGSGQDIFVRGILTESISAMRHPTLYTLYGDWFIGACAGIVLAICVLYGRRQKLSGQR